VDTLIRNGTVLTNDASDTVLNADILIQGRKIAHIAPYGSLRHSSLTRVIDAKGAAVIPGFVQCHVHLCQTLMRGHADDLPLLAWLRERIWPLEAAHNDASLAASANLGLLEMMRAGTTTILDMGTVFGHDVILQSCFDSGIRAFSGKAMMDEGQGVPKRLRESTKASLAESDRLATHWNQKDDGRIRYAYAPRFVLSCTEKLFRSLADRLTSAADVMVHSHAAEHPDEQKYVRSLLGADDIDVITQWGVCGPRAVFAHGVQLTPAQMRRASELGTRFVHCPSANLKLGSGIAQVEKMLQAGMRIGLGADGAPCNNTMDPWVEMRLAALLSKVAAGTTSLAARRAFRLATLDGAHLLGIEALTGSLEVGKDADLAVVDLEGEHVQPAEDVFSKLVYSCRSTDVRDVFVRGEHVVRDRTHLTIDRERTIAAAKKASREQRTRAKL
jgi:5-methylthioadenosine/S-adenosylhomocysteine deaminase